MKKLLFILLTSISLISFAQAPQEISYQGVARNVSGSLLANQNIGIKLDLHQGNSGGAIVFSESHSKTTNAFGLFSLSIGSANTTAFTAINWANGPYFLEVSMDPAGGSSYTSVGIQQFMSVPYALYAKTAGNAGPTYTAGTGINLSGNIISNTAPDQTVTITPAGSASVTGTYPNFTINTPTNQVYSAGNGIDITGGVITNTASAVTPTITGTGATTVTGVYPNLTINTPTVAPDQVVTLLGTNAATVTGVYPNFTVDVPNGTLLPTGFIGQFLYNNGTIWDTLPRNNLYFDGTNFGIGTTAPQANFHVIGAGRFEASMSTPQIYTDNIKITGGTAGQVLTSDAIGNGTWQNLPPTTSTVTGTGIAIVTSTATNNFNVSVPQPTLNYNTTGNILSLTHGGANTTTVALTGTGSSTINMTGAGIASVSPTSGSAFTVTVPNPTITIASGSISISNGNSVAIPSPSLTINSNSLTINGPGGNTVVLPTAASQSLAVLGNSLSITGGNTVTIPITSVVSTNTNITVSSSVGVYSLTAVTPTIIGAGATTVSGSYPNFTISSPTVAAAVTQSLTGTGISSVTSGANTFTVNTPMPSYTSSTGVLSFGGTNTVVATPSLSISGNVIRSGAASNTITLPTSSAPSLTLSGTDNNLLSAGGNTVTINTYTPGTGITMTGTAPNYTLSSPNQSLTINSNTLSITGGNTVILPASSTTTLTQGANVTVLGSAPSYTVSAVTPTLNVVGGTLTGAYPTQTLSIPTSSTTILTQSTGVTVTGSAPNYTISSASQSLSISGNTLSITGANTVMIPTSSVVAGNANIIVNQSGNTFSVSSIAPPLSFTGTTLTSGPATNSVSLSSLAVWSNSVGVLYPTTLTNSVGIGTSGPLTDKMEINYPSSPTNTHLHLKQTGADAFSRIKFSNTVAPAKYWINSVTSDPTDANSGYNVFYFNGTTGNNLFTVAGDGRVGINPFGTVPNAMLDVRGRVRIDSSLTMGAYTSSPAVSFVNEGRIYYDKLVNKFKVSENGQPYVNMIGGGGASPWIQGAGIITQNNIGDLVGIGTPAPAYNLDVRNSSDVLINLSSSGATQGTQAGLRLSMFDSYIGKQYTLAAEKSDATANSGASNFVIKSHYSTAGGTLNNMVIKDQDLIFNESKTTGSAFGNVIIANGNLGVGTNFPSTKLEVIGKTKTDTIQIVRGANAGFVLTVTDASGNARWQSASGNGNWSLNGNAGTIVGTNYIGTTDATNLMFKVNNNQSGLIDQINGKTFFGYLAGSSTSTTALNNTAYGFFALRDNTVGGSNTAIGTGALRVNNAYDNTAVGTSVLTFNTIGDKNVAMGRDALSSNVAGSNATAFGTNAMQYANNTTTAFTNWNVAVGFEALRGSTSASANTGNENTSLGYQTLFGNTSGSWNTAIGKTALYSNTSGSQNVANGMQSLYSNTTGGNNTANGKDALQYNTIGGNNTANGMNALNSNVAGNNATAIGYNAMQYANNTTTAFTNQNVAVGFEALRGSTTASSNTGNLNTGIGYQALWFVTSGFRNTATGNQALSRTTSGTDNTATGNIALTDNTTGNGNTANGTSALAFNLTGSNNTAMGLNALMNNSSNNSTAIGMNALVSNSTGTANVALGYQAGYTAITTNANTTGSNNTFIGSNSGPGVSSASSLQNATAIGNGALVTASNNMFFGNANVIGWGFGVAPGTAAIKVGTNGANGNGASLTVGGIWTNASDSTKKFNIKNISYGLKEVMKLRPVSYKMKGTNYQDIGFIAQEVKLILPELVYGKEGEMTMSYGQLTSVITKAIQEQQRQIEEQKATNDKLQKQLIELQQQIDIIKSQLKK